MDIPKSEEQKEVDRIMKEYGPVKYAVPSDKEILDNFVKGQMFGKCKLCGYSGKIESLTSCPDCHGS